jgi:hypothetical protein
MGTRGMGNWLPATSQKIFMAQIWLKKPDELMNELELIFFHLVCLYFSEEKYYFVLLSAFLSFSYTTI